MTPQDIFRYMFVTAAVLGYIRVDDNGLTTDETGQRIHALNVSFASDEEVRAGLTLLANASVARWVLTAFKALGMGIPAAKQLRQVFLTPEVPADLSSL